MFNVILLNEDNMKNIIEYFYNIEINKIILKEEKIFIVENNNLFIFKEIVSFNQEVMYETQKYKCFHTIIYNKYQNIVTTYENKKYILMKINVNQNRKITLNDVVKISSIIINKKYYDYNHQKLWTKKTDCFENYIKNKHNHELPYREYYDYYLGLAEIALEYSININKSNIRYGFSYKRIKENFTLYDLLDPTNVIIAPIVRNLSEYLKIICFDSLRKNKEIKIELTYDEYILFISRMIFPTYFFDLFNDKIDNIKFKKIINNSHIYEENICYLINCIKKQGYNIPVINWLKN